MNIAQFVFTRPAFNASFSNRTKKLGTKKGTIKDAVRRALELTSIHSIREVTIRFIDGGYVGTVGSFFWDDMGKQPHQLTQISLTNQMMKELLE